jgi:hypothetical protein
VSALNRRISDELLVCASPFRTAASYTGPEGSALALPVFAILFFVLWLIYRRRAPSV